MPDKVPVTRATVIAAKIPRREAPKLPITEPPRLTQREALRQRLNRQNMPKTLHDPSNGSARPAHWKKK